MTQNFKAIVIDNQNEKFSRAIKDLKTSDLKDGNVLVKVDYSSLNFKDALILNNGGKIVRKFPLLQNLFICFLDYFNFSQMNNEVTATIEIIFIFFYYGVSKIPS